MSEKATFTRVILEKEIKEKLPINYDAIQELAENVDDLLDCLFENYWRLRYSGEREYVEYVAFREVLYTFSIGFVKDLEYDDMLKDVKTQFLAYRLLFNLISDDDKKIHIGILDRCKDTHKAWELFNRIEHLINNFETEILLSDTEMNNE